MDTSGTGNMHLLLFFVHIHVEEREADFPLDAKKSCRPPADGAKPPKVFSVRYSAARETGRRKPASWRRISLFSSLFTITIRKYRQANKSETRPCISKSAGGRSRMADEKPTRGRFYSGRIRPEERSRRRHRPPPAAITVSYCITCPSPLSRGNSGERKRKLTYFEKSRFNSLFCLGYLSNRV